MTPRPVAQLEKRLHDATVAEGAIVDRLPLPPRCVEAMAGVGCQLTASLQMRRPRIESHSQNRGCTTQTWQAAQSWIGCLCCRVVLT